LLDFLSFEEQPIIKKFLKLKIGGKVGKCGTKIDYLLASLMSQIVALAYLIFKQK
jgi:hypothetical protein